MDLTFLYSPGFVREWDRHRLPDSDLQVLEQTIGKAPASAPVMRGTGGLRKIRLAPPSMHRGKSGAMRVGYAYFAEKHAIIVVAMFSKNETANFAASDQAEIAKWLKRVERAFT